MDGCETPQAGMPHVPRFRSRWLQLLPLACSRWKGHLRCPTRRVFLEFPSRYPHARNPQAWRRKSGYRTAWGQPVTVPPRAPADRTEFALPSPVWSLISPLFEGKLDVGARRFRPALSNRTAVGVPILSQLVTTG